MFGYQTSIRRKITFGYYLIVATIIGLSIFTFMELSFLEKKIISGDIISEFFDTTLEIRRFEKNFFLYRKPSDFEENKRYVVRALELLDSKGISFSVLAEPGLVSGLHDNLQRYRSLMDEYGKTVDKSAIATSIDIMVIERKIRETGKQITTVAENMSKTERTYLQRILSNSRRVLVFSIVILCLAVIVIGQALSRMIARPLKLLEKSMQVIAEGKFETIHIDSKDREIVSLTNAFTKMLKELELRQRHLVHSEKLASLGTLLSGVAHELNNPLSNISSSCQILNEEIEDTDVDYKKELLGQIEEQTERARNIVRSLLEFSRDKDFKKELLPLKDLLNDTIRFVKGQFPARISLVLQVPDDIVVFVDKQRIQQVFLNLLKNAIEAIEEEGTITIQAVRHKAADKSFQDESEIRNYMRYRGKCTLEEDTVDILISDTGTGIPEETLSKVFDPFFTTKDVGKGSGLGLYIVHEIIDEHDGCIAVDSTMGRGTTFLIRLPLKES